MHGTAAMSLRNHIEAMPHDRLVKELHAHAKRNAQLEDEASRLRHQVFWLEVRDRRLSGLILEVLERWWPFVHAHASNAAKDLRKKLSDGVQP